jgi:hypothetical protein
MSAGEFKSHMLDDGLMSEERLVHGVSIFPIVVIESKHILTGLQFYCCLYSVIASNISHTVLWCI